MVTYIEFMSENVQIKFTVIWKYKIPIHHFISLPLTFKHCFSS